LIARDPACEGLVVGDIVADAVEGVTSPRLDKFRWRPGLHVARSQEAAGFQG
jgi:hypothetical protein